MMNAFNYWDKEDLFDAQTELLEELYKSLGGGYPRGTTDISFETLGNKQRESRIGCIYFAGSRIDNSYCIGTKKVGLLHSALPTDYSKAIRPAYHEDHCELIVCTHGTVVIEYMNGLPSKDTIITKSLEPGNYFFIERNVPHKVSLNPLRACVSKGSPPEDIHAGFLAIKMGNLGGKALKEDLTKWSEPRPIIERWKEDVKFLRDEILRRSLCVKYSIDEEELREILEAQAIAAGVARRGEK